MAKVEKIVFLAGLLLVFGYPFVQFLVYSKWLLAIVFSVAVVGAYLFMRKTMCSQCMNFACPLNLVDEGKQATFFQLNPDYAAGWQKK
jgi:hypothetical protein